MATWKFLNIGKANAEIERLEAELAAAKAAAPAGPNPPKPAEDKTAALELKIEELSATLSVLGDRIATIEKASTEAAASFKVEIARLDKSFSDYQASAKELGTRIAAEVTARQGQPPLKTDNAAGNGNGNGNGSLRAQLDAIKDPKARTVFYRKNKAAIDAEFSAANRQ